MANPGFLWDTARQLWATTEPAAHKSQASKSRSTIRRFRPRAGFRFRSVTFHPETIHPQFRREISSARILPVQLLHGYTFEYPAQKMKK
jgi:hypothetical protein